MNMSDPVGQASKPVGWRRQNTRGEWNLVNQRDWSDWDMRFTFKCQPVFGERLPMPKAHAENMAQQFAGLDLLREVERWHGI